MSKNSTKQRYEAMTEWVAWARSKKILPSKKKKNPQAGYKQDNRY